MRGDEDEVNAVRHQAVRPHLHVVLDSLLAEQVKIDGLVAVFEEDWLAPVSALSASGDDESGESCRMEKCIRTTGEYVYRPPIPPRFPRDIYRGHFFWWKGVGVPA